MLDKNKDGKLSKEELAAMAATGGLGGDQSEQMFNGMDKNGDGAVTKAEASAFFKMMAQMMDGGGMGGMPGMGGMGGMPRAKPGRATNSKFNPTSKGKSADADDIDPLPAHDEL